MNKLEPVQSQDLARLEGYLHAAQLFLFNGQLDVILTAALFEILDAHVTDDDVLSAAYPKGHNLIERSVQCAANDMILDVNQILTLPRGIWKRETSMPAMIEDRLRQGYWAHITACFDYTAARIMKVGPHVPYVNIFRGFAYILYASSSNKCLLLVGTSSD
jgi:hypothetical protein